MTTPTSSDSRCSAFEKIEELSKKMLAKSTVARFVDKGEDSKVVVKLIERLREAMVCYQVGDCCTLGSNTTNKRTDITTAGDLPPNHSPRSKVLPIASGINTDRSVSPVIVRYILEASGGNPCSTAVTALAHGLIETLIGEGQAGVRHGAVG